MLPSDMLPSDMLPSEGSLVYTFKKIFSSNTSNKNYGITLAITGEILTLWVTPYTPCRIKSLVKLSSYCKHKRLCSKVSKHSSKLLYMSYSFQYNTVLAYVKWSVEKIHWILVRIIKILNKDYNWDTFSNTDRLKKFFHRWGPKFDFRVCLLILMYKDSVDLSSCSQIFSAFSRFPLFLKPQI